MGDMDNCYLLKEGDKENKSGESIFVPKIQPMLQKDDRVKSNKSKEKAPSEMIVTPDQKCTLNTGNPINQNYKGSRIPQVECHVFVITRRNPESGPK